MIFDFNGVLFIDSDFHEIAWQNTISRILNNKVLTNTEINNYIHGRNNREVFEFYLQRKIDNDELNYLSELKEAQYRDLCLQSKERFVLNEGAIQLFEFLLSNNIDFSIATASGKSNLDFFFKYLNLDKWFEFSKIIYDDGLIPGKPRPDFYRWLRKKLKNCQKTVL